ncbi:hypothetical protein F2P81_007408 [Scophthalmus maximus]|uniref:Uncharacterized protein n=1 Tax=Scophthalmus maximus TaxID=52904 RepID=A0A6A4TCF9_SCOMX|nr:hypothetical protein F2P81_007408 [Scophthalmus maximus]
MKAIFFPTEEKLNMRQSYAVMLHGYLLLGRSNPSFSGTFLERGSVGKQLRRRWPNSRAEERSAPIQTCTWTRRRRPFRNGKNKGEGERERAVNILYSGDFCHISRQSQQLSAAD